MQQWPQASSWSPVMCTWTVSLARALNILKGQQIHFPQILNSSAISELMWSLNNSDSCVTQLNSMFRDFSLSWHWAGLQRHFEGPLFSFPSGKLIRTKPFSLSRLWERVKFVFKTTHLVHPPPHHCVVWCCYVQRRAASLPARQQTGNNGAFPVRPHQDRTERKLMV